MTDFFLQMGISNAFFSLVLAIVAMVVGAKSRRPYLAYMLWLLVFVKLVTPPIVTIPIFTIPVQGETAVAVSNQSEARPLLSDSSQLNVETSQDIETSQWSGFGSTVRARSRVWITTIWLMGSVVILGWSMVRVYRFNRLLARESEVAPEEIQIAAKNIGYRLGLKAVPVISTISARLSPMVWWSGGKVRIVIPTTLLDEMDIQDWKWILAHELAHVRRRDYLVRWLEWAGCVLFWWNPVVWWAQRNLRATEEICCDELVISCLNPKPKLYANSLLSALEFIACPALRPPVMASEINSGGALERRFKMIVTYKPNQSKSRLLQVFVLLCILALLPLSVVSAQDYEAVSRRRAAVAADEQSSEQEIAMHQDFEAVSRRLRAAIRAGELNEEQAVAMFSALEQTIQQNERSDTQMVQLEDDVERVRVRRETDEISEEEAISRLDSFRSDFGQEQRKEYEATQERLDVAVEAGEMSEEEARSTLRELRQRMAEQTERILGPSLSRIRGGRGGVQEIGRGSRFSRTFNTQQDDVRSEAEQQEAEGVKRISEEEASSTLRELRPRTVEQTERILDPSSPRERGGRGGVQEIGRGSRRFITQQDDVRSEAEQRLQRTEVMLERILELETRLESMREEMLEIIAE